MNGFWRAPHYLWLLLLVPVAAGFLWQALQRRRSALEKFAEYRLLDTIAPTHTSRRPILAAVLVLAALTLLCVSLAGPKWGFHWEEVQREGIDLIVAIDTSRSMLARDVRPDRLERAKLAVQDLVGQLKGDRIGLIAFAGTSFVQCPLTLDYPAFLESLRAISVGIIPKGGTAVGQAIRAGIAAFEGKQGRHTALVVITDGEDHEGDVEAAAQEAANAGIRIFTVGIGTPAGELIEVDNGSQRGFLKDRRGQVVKSRLDDEALRMIANTTNGAYLLMQGTQVGLEELYDDHISKMDTREISTSMQRRYRERFQIPLAIAFALLAAEPLLRARRRSRPGPWPWQGRGR